MVSILQLIELKKNPHPETKRVRATLKPSGKNSKRESFSADLQNRINILQDQNKKLKESNQAVKKIPFLIQKNSIKFVFLIIQKIIFAVIRKNNSKSSFSLMQKIIRFFLIRRIMFF
jgi:hypothetical protein